MKASLILFFLFGIMFFASTPATSAQQQTALVRIDAIVRSVAGPEITVELKLPDFSATTGSFVSEIALQVVQKSLFLEGIKTELNGIPATVTAVRNSMISLGLEKSIPLAVGTMAKLVVPRKTLAVMDFEVIRGNKESAGRATLEGLTAALVDSGHFAIVDRSRLKVVLDEQALSLSGATRDTPEKMIGQLLTADLVLTGTFAEVDGNAWDINLKLMDARTGQTVGAITVRTPRFKPQELRHTGPMADDFEEDSTYSAWLTGYRKTGKATVTLDEGEGAEGTKHSLRMTFDFSAKSENPLFAAMENRQKRDLSRFNSIEFFIKADQPLTGSISVWTSMPDDPDRIDNWVSQFDIGTDWKRIRVPFGGLTINRRWIRVSAKKFGAKPGDQTLRLDRVEALRIGVDSDRHQSIAGNVWLDKVRFSPN